MNISQRAAQSLSKPNQSKQKLIWNVILGFENIKKEPPNQIYENRTKATAALATSKPLTPKFHLSRRTQALKQLKSVVMNLFEQFFLLRNENSMTSKLQKAHIMNILVWIC